METFIEIKRIAIIATISIRYWTNIGIAENPVKPSLILNFVNKVNINGDPIITNMKKYFVFSKPNLYCNGVYIPNRITEIIRVIR